MLEPDFIGLVSQRHKSNSQQAINAKQGRHPFITGQMRKGRKHQIIIRPSNAKLNIALQKFHIRPQNSKHLNLTPQHLQSRDSFFLRVPNNPKRQLLPKKDTQEIQQLNTRIREAVKSLRPDGGETWYAGAINQCAGNNDNSSLAMKFDLHYRPQKHQQDFSACKIHKRLYSNRIRLPLKPKQSDLTELPPHYRFANYW